MTSKPKHKPLEWRRDIGDGIIADSALGEVRIRDDIKGRLHVFIDWKNVSWPLYSAMPDTKTAKVFAVAYIDERLAKYVELSPPVPLQQID